MTELIDLAELACVTTAFSTETRASPPSAPSRWDNSDSRPTKATGPAMRPAHQPPPARSTPRTETGPARVMPNDRFGTGHSSADREQAVSRASDAS